MSKFTPKVKFVTEFDDDTISMELARMKRKHVIMFAPHIEGYDDTGNAVIGFENKIEFAEVMTNILPEVVSKFQGPTYTDDDGAVVSMSLEEVIEETYFTDLVGAIMKELFIISRPQVKEETDIKKPSNESTENSEAENTAEESSADSA